MHSKGAMIHQERLRQLHGCAALRTTLETSRCSEKLHKPTLNLALLLEVVLWTSSLWMGQFRPQNRLPVRDEGARLELHYWRKWSPGVAILSLGNWPGCTALLQYGQVPLSTDDSSRLSALQQKLHARQ